MVDAVKAAAESTGGSNAREYISHKGANGNMMFTLREIWRKDSCSVSLSLTFCTILPLFKSLVLADITTGAAPLQTGFAGATFIRHARTL